MRVRRGTSFSRMEDLTVPVAGADLVRAALGSWPSFHDAEVLWVEMVRDRVTRRTPPTLLLELDAADDVRVGPDGASLPRQLAVVTLLFRDVADVVLADFGFQNVISELTLAPAGAPAGGRIMVTLEPCFGLEGGFTCAAVEVPAAEPYPSRRAPVV